MVQMNAESINFSWKSIRFRTGSLRWADSPEEVPLSDVTRGYPLTQNPLWAVPLWENRHKAVRAAPKIGYPRIVRWDLFEPGQILQQDAPNILSEVRSVEKYIFSGRQKNTSARKRDLILALAEKYGPPYHEDKNTLEAWLGLGAKINWHFWAHRILQTDGWLALEGEVLSTLQKYGLDGEFEPDFTKRHLSARNEVLQYRKVHKSLLQYEIEKLSMLLLLKQAFHILADTKMWGDSEEFRHTMAKLVSPHITKDIQSGKRSTRSYLELSYGRLSITCPVGVWTEFKLAEVWRNNLLLKVCVNCGRPFLPQRKHAIYCTKSGSCISTARAKGFS